ncbi:MAG: hypothetical protein A2Z06_02375, partial [Candidatus Glassbacteria bacterium RBG_16_58_8]
MRVKLIEERIKRRIRMAGMSGNRIWGIMGLVLLIGWLPGCAPHPRIYPQSGLEIRERTTVALLPFDNLTDIEGASRHMHDIFLVELLRVEGFSVVDPGEVERLLAEERIRMVSELSREQIQKIGADLGVSLLIQGSILEYGIRQVQGYTTAEVPYISVFVKMVDTTHGEIVWASSYSRNGNDTEVIFGFGRISSLNRLT